MEQLLVGDEAPGVTHENLDDVPLGRGEPDELFPSTYLLGGEVEREVGRGHDRLALREHGSTHCRPQTCEELVHAERLGQVVVGTKVERLDLGRLGPTPRQHDDRHRRPAPEAAHDVEPVHAGKSEVEDDDVGMVARRELERLFTGEGDVGVVSTRFEVDFEGLADARIVLDHECPHSAASRVMAMVAPPPGVSSMLIVAAHRLDEPLGDGEPETDAVVRGACAVAEALERLEHRLPLVSGDAGAAVDDAEVDLLSDLRRLDPHAGAVGRPVAARC